MKIEKSSVKKASARNLEFFRKRLLAELKTHQDRVERARRELPVDSDPDDDAGVASRSAYREVTMGKLERDLQTIIEIERALRRLDAGQYATCVACQLPIADARLNALPWTRTCIQCAGRGGNFTGPFQLTPNPAH
jgi:RNA polymerase-binding transcription factor DksA